MGCKQQPPASIQEKDLEVLQLMFASVWLGAHDHVRFTIQGPQNLSVSSMPDMHRSKRANDQPLLRPNSRRSRVEAGDLRASGPPAHTHVFDGSHGL